eukprot:m.186662 g.186662  ORF g.186662 m.186662 type:complete len:1016 (-) comp32275_c4_seq6:246-3293(-)
MSSEMDFKMDDTSLSLPSFQMAMFSELQQHDALLVLAKGLGIDHFTVSLLKLYCDPSTLVLVIGATTAQQEFYTDQLELASLNGGHPSHTITSDMNVEKRNEMYLGAGVLFVTSRILVMDILLKKAPTDLITGIIVLNAHTITPTSTEAFIMRLYRFANRTGFIKALSDAPERLAQGFNKVEKLMKSLWVRKLLLWPRFQQEVHTELSRNQPDVIEMSVPLTPRMERIQQAISELIAATLKELKRAKPTLDMEHLNAETALLNDFDNALNRQLDPVWHLLSKTVKQLCKDIRTLRNLVKHLYYYDSVAFYNYLELLRASNHAFNEDSQFLFLDATDDLFENAKARVFPPPTKTTKSHPQPQHQPQPQSKANSKRLPSDPALSTTPSTPTTTPTTIPTTDATESAPITIEISTPSATSTPAHVPPTTTLPPPRTTTATTATATSQPPPPPTREEILNKIEPNPKWDAVKQVLHEIKEEDSTGVTLICGTDTVACNQLQNYLRFGPEYVLEKQLQRYYRWRGRAAQMSAPGNVLGGARGGQQQSTGSNVRGRGRSLRGRGRRGRGGRGTFHKGGGGTPTFDWQKELEQSAANELKRNQPQHQNPSSIAHSGDGSGLPKPDNDDDEDKDHGHDQVELDPHVEILNSFQRVEDNSVIIFPLQSTDASKIGATLTATLDALSPKYIILLDPNLTVLRQIEVFNFTRSSQIRLYLLLYTESIQEQKYLTSVRVERQAFENLIRAKQMMAVPTDQDGRKGHRQNVEKARFVELETPGKKSIHRKRKRDEAEVAQPKVIVDMREFRSSLPSLIHARGMEISPVTIEVGDYILSPDMCVERKSVPDLIGSLNSGRLFKQATEMIRHYTNAILLIEFDEDRPFSLLGSGDSLTDEIEFKNTMSKLTLLTITFPQLRILWSRNPQVTAETFATLKKHFAEPDEETAAGFTPESLDPENSSDKFAHGPRTFLSKLPGITSKNIRFIMDKVDTLEQLSKMDLTSLQKLLENKVEAKKLFDFFRNCGSV